VPFPPPYRDAFSVHAQPLGPADGWGAGASDHGDDDSVMGLLCQLVDAEEEGQRKAVMDRLVERFDARERDMDMMQQVRGGVERDGDPTEWPGD
jgi:hypothetical protein